MKRTLILIGLLSCVCAFAAPQRELVWPKGKMPDAQEHQIAAMTNESSQEGFKPEKHRVAYLDWFDAPAPEKRNGGCKQIRCGVSPDQARPHGAPLTSQIRGNKFQSG